MRHVRLIGRRIRYESARAGGWLDRNLGVDRLVSIVGLFATVALGILSIAVVTPGAVGPLIALAAVGSASLAMLMVRLGRTRAREFVLGVHAQPYRISDSRISVDILDEGRMASIRHEERIVSLQDHMVALRRVYRGDWAPLAATDLTCEAPAGAVVADSYSDGADTFFLISLRRIFNQGNAFKHIGTLWVRDGFRNPDEEYFEWRVYPRIDRLSMSVILPLGRVLVSNSARIRVGDPSVYDEYDLPPSNIERVGGRDRISWTWDTPKPGHTYRLVWNWVPGSELSER